MPPSGRKGKTKARRAPAAEVHEPSDAETPETIPTPSRASRKRARGSEAVAPAPRKTRRKTKDTTAVEREDTEGTEAHEHSDAETESALPTEQEIIQHLRISDKPVNATEDFANDLLEGQEHVPGYGKIAGRDWAFIIRKVEVNIGRPEAQDKLTMDESGLAAGPSSKTVVDIDLGPDRQVSRSHAIISYDGDTEQWLIIVNGRNGLRVDNNLLKRGAKSYLRNGSVIEINGTQMAFITTPAENSGGPMWDASIIKQAQKSSEGEDGEHDLHAANHTFQQVHPSSHGPLPEANYDPADVAGQQSKTHPHSQRAMQATPGTPMRGQQSMMKSSPAANYARGVMMESTETIDYSADDAKVLKPPHSYAQLIGMAILSTHEQQMTLNNIYKWIMANYAFYRFNTAGWQNSIRHNLSLNKAFTKIARRTDEPGKGMKWMIEPTEFDTFVQQGMKGCRRPNPIPGTQSTLDSPTSPMLASRVSANGVRTQDDTTPPLHTYQPPYPTATEAYTPDRGPKRQVSSEEGGVGLGINGGSAEYDFLTRSTPRHGMNAIANAGSPPALFVNDDSRMGTLDTPFPLRPSQRLAPPSTLKRPSDFIQFSSPAPFWKMEGLVGSTPFKPYDLSPIKTPFSNIKKDVAEDAKEERQEVDSEEREMTDPVDKDDEADGGSGSPVVESSSPPRASSGDPAPDASPTLSKPATAVAKTLSQLAASKEEEGKRDVEWQPANEYHPQQLAQPDQVPQFSLSANSAHAPLQPAAHASAPNGIHGPQPAANGYHHPPAQPMANGGGGYMHAAAPAPNGYHHAAAADDGEDEGIDLAK